jgi:exonuclease III
MKYLFLFLGILTFFSFSIPSMENTDLGITVSCINVNSLNMSSANKPIHLKKIFGVVKLKSDIILLSDVRLSNRNLVSSKSDITAILRNNQFGSYTPYFNSSSNKRGVGILFNNSFSFSVEEERADEEENYLLSKVTIKGKTYIIGSIYGPNNHNAAFFSNLERSIRSLGDFPIILGGDWNLLYSNLPVEINPDCINMANVPNHRHTELLSELCNNLDLLDPFRALYPDKKMFTFSPRFVGARNKSRLDFFLISSSIFGSVTDCAIADSLQSSLFDHKAVTLSFSGKKKIPGP